MNDYRNRNTINIIPSVSNIIQISSGYYFSILLDNNGNVFSFGSNSVILILKIKIVWTIRT
jgi:alpha-tubulin suppressor-like RCC1 family protein